MITSTGNNFGADSITLKDFQSEKVLVLNGKFSFSNKSEAFKAATVLEIYVPTLSIPKSGMSGCCTNPCRGASAKADGALMH